MKNLSTYVNCIAGAIQVGDYQGLLGDAGFTGKFIISHPILLRWPSTIPLHPSKH